MSAAAPLTRLGRYRLDRVLGRGAMGLVYEGVDTRLERVVAVKTILKNHLLDATLADDYSARFIREAQAAARLNHPNIVTVFDFGEEGDVAYLVMEFIRGRELAAHFEQGDYFDLSQAVRIMDELLAALGYAHEHGIVHRDVKPANVMIEPGGRVKLTDFGVARLADSTLERTMPGTMVGTPSYMSPEQIQGQAVGSRADLFAAGVILYQFLAHRKPFMGGGAWELQKQIVQEDPPPPSTLNKDLPPAFDAVVMRALAKRPEQRYATAEAFAQDLRRALATKNVTAATVVSAAVADPDATVIATTAGPAVSEAIPSPHADARVPAAASSPTQRRPLTALLVAGSIVLGVLAVASWRSSTVSPSAKTQASVPPAAAPSRAQAVPAAASASLFTPDLPASTPLAMPAATVAERPAAPAPALSAAPRKAAPRAAAPLSAQCVELRQRLELGEPLTTEQLDVFKRQCR